MDINKQSITEVVKQRVLIADDQDSIRELLHEKLSQEGYEVIEATNGKECLEIFKKEKPPVVITDIMMPGANGEEVVRTIKQISPTTIALILTGFGTIKSVREMMAAGCDGYLLKPLSNLNSIILAITQAQERQRMLVCNAVLLKHSREQSEAISAILEAIFFPVSHLQESLTAMGVAAKEKDYDELKELLEAAEEEITKLGSIVEQSGSFNSVTG